MNRSIIIAISVFFMFFLIIFIGSFIHTTIDKNFYERECQKLNTNCEESFKVRDYLIKGSFIGLNYNERELSHMKDVKNLTFIFNILFLILLISFIIGIIFVYKYNKNRFYNMLSILFIYGSIISILITLLISLGLFINFNYGFDLFHRIFFSNGTWVFNSTDKLIELFPEQFFIDAYYLIIIKIILSSLLFLGIGLFIKKFK